MDQTVSPEAEVEQTAKASQILVALAGTYDPRTDSRYCLTTEKPANRWFRWNLIWFIFFCVFFIPLPFWLYPVSCTAGYVSSMIVMVWQIIVLLVCMISASLTMKKMYLARDRKEKWGLYDMRTEKLVHMVVTASYKEPIEIITATIDSLKEQTVVNRLFVVIGFEERTPDFAHKKQMLLQKYEKIFLHIMITQHPHNIPGEIPGKSSNINYAIREGVKQLKTMGLHELDYTTVTTCDSDNPFSPRYFEYLGYDFLKTGNCRDTVWQAPLFYNLNLDKRPFFVRVTGIQRAVFMMGILIPQNLTSMSVFSMSLELMEKGYVHPVYQMEDIINIVRRMVRIHKMVQIRLIPYPVISGPTSGETYKQEIIEWARQARRWTIGAAEVFHYLCIKWSRFDTCSGIIYAVLFTQYYGFVICGMSLYSFTSLITSSITTATGECNPASFLSNEHLIYLPILGLAFFYIFAWAFAMDRLGTRLMNVEENINIFRNILHWLLSPLVLLAYSVIEYYAIIEVAVFGKSVCKHGASKKTALVKF